MRLFETLRERRDDTNYVGITKYTNDIKSFIQGIEELDEEEEKFMALPLIWGNSYLNSNKVCHQNPFTPYPLTFSPFQ